MQRGGRSPILVKSPLTARTHPLLRSPVATADISFIIDRVKRTKHVRSSDVLALFGVMNRHLYDLTLNPAARENSVPFPDILASYYSEVSVIQGGTPTNILTNWTMLNPAVFAQASALVGTLPPNPFSQYVILGNGLVRIRDCCACRDCRPRRPRRPRRDWREYRARH